MAAWALLALLALAPAAAGGMLSFASYYGDHMVLQQKPSGAVVWGHGELGAVVTLTLSGASGLVIMEKTAQVKGPSGTWTTVLNPMDRGGPYALTAEQGLENVTLRDIYFGDVWLCSGQSNMAMTVLQVANASQELAAAARYPYVRVFAAAPARSSVELEDLEQIDLPWSIPTAEILGHGNFTYFSAVCWLLGRSLYDALGTPIGLVEVAWGGTPIEAWSSRRVLQACGLPEDTGSTSPHEHHSGPKTPSVLWNAMIHPLLNMTLRGVAWYQGEENTLLNTDQYNCTFPALIADWRWAFHTGSAGQTEPRLPFGFVQLSTYRHESADDSFPRLRWHQTADLGVVPNARMPSTFMAVAMDLGDEHSPYGRFPEAGSRCSPGQAALTGDGLQLQQGAGRGSSQPAVPRHRALGVPIPARLHQPAILRTHAEPGSQRHLRVVRGELGEAGGGAGAAWPEWRLREHRIHLVVGLMALHLLLHNGDLHNALNRVRVPQDNCPGKGKQRSVGCCSHRRGTLPSAPLPRPSPIKWR
uniref:Sialic acid acetylesterase n=1 Tax=Junco hyemalis TaxID=40217 RepID=A0A8C5JHU8_JUNHY